MLNQKRDLTRGLGERNHLSHDAILNTQCYKEIVVHLRIYIGGKDIRVDVNFLFHQRTRNQASCDDGVFK